MKDDGNSDIRSNGNGNFAYGFKNFNVDKGELNKKKRFSQENLQNSPTKSQIYKEIKSKPK